MQVLRYGSAVLVIALATVIRLLLDPLLGDGFPFITFFCSIVLVAWLVGLGPSLAALLLSCLSAAYFILPPRGSLGIYSQENQVGLGIFFLTGLAVALLSGELRAAQRRAQRAEEAERGQRQQLQVTLQELQEEITRRRQAEEKLLEEHERLRVTLASIGDAVIATDVAGRVVFLNPVAEALTGWKQHEAEGQPLDNIFPLLSEKTGEPIEHPVAKVIREGVVVGLGNHTLLVSRDGTARPIADSGAPIMDATGKVIGVVLVFRDVTEQRRSEWAVRDSEARKTAILDTALDCIITMDHQGNVVEFNPAAEKTFGYRRAETVGKPLAELIIPPSLREQHYRGLAHYMATGEGPLLNKRIEMPALRADGTQFPVELSITRIPIGEPPVFTAYLREISERKQLEHGLRQRVEELAVADRRKNEFLAILSHELRNPLAPIRTAVDLLRLRGSTDTDLRWGTDVIDRQVQQLGRLVHDLLDLSRISLGKIALYRECIPISAIVSQALETSRPNIEANGHELTVTLPTENFFVDGDLTRLAQVVANLLNNAAKYTRRGGHIWLSAERSPLHGDGTPSGGPGEGEIVLRVRDNGIGIPAEMLSNIFNMFTQVDTSLERKTAGLGIGLTLARQLIEMHDGRIEAHSAGLGQGSEFLVRLPLAKPQAVQAAKAPADAPSDGRMQQPARRILVVDDNKDAAESFAKLLELAGHEVRMAHDGLEGVNLAGTFRPDVVLLDIGLPKMNGFNAARQIREQPWGKNMMLIALTGWGQEEDQQRSKEAGFDHHLVKPVKAKALNDLLASVPSSAARNS